MIIAEDRGGENDRATYRLSRDRQWQDREVLTTYRQCNGASVHPINGEMYFNSYEKDNFFALISINILIKDLALRILNNCLLFTIHNGNIRF
ncbi:hypothetical protein OKW96_13535 [Sphingobacterium sp. KU25419]|nr:hypothetical protein OKW96_13535 [Sphingobacterium sp. KU25419]